MAIGIFENEQKVLEAVDRLRALGWDRQSLRVIVRNEDNVPLLVGRPDVPLEGVAGILEAREHGDGADGRGQLPFVAIHGTGSGQWTALPFLVYSDENAALPGRNEAEGTAEVLMEMGLPAPSVRECREALLQGKCVLVAEAASPEAAGRALREAGAERVLLS